jgi:protoheme IX farnesyltransferase
MRSATFDFLKLTKPTITLLVLATTFAGFLTGSRGTISLPLLIHTLVGTAFVAGGASAFNMYIERAVDALMHRTALRPLASGRLQSGPVLVFALVISVAGFVYLFVFVNHITSLLSAIIFAGYVFLYTPLKTRTWLCTLVGAVPGALPIVMGWTAATASISLNAGVLFAIVFLWQLPHFYSIGWIYREDYARAGLPMLAVIDLDGQRSGRQAVLFISALIVITFIPSMIGITGLIYVTGTALLGFIFLAYGIRFARLRNVHSARRLFVASALYLPVILSLLVVDSFVL